MNKEQIFNSIKQQKILPIFYHTEKELCAEVIKSLYAGGLRIIELANRGNNAFDQFVHIKNLAVKLPGLQLGVGTIKDAASAKKFINAGAEFLVSPIVKREIAEVANQENILWIPGCFTPTEISIAEDEGAELVKIFPASSGGTSHIKAIKEIFPHLNFMPTGGVEANAENINKWLQAGSVAVGLGSNLVTKRILESRDYNELKTQTHTLLGMLNNNVAA